MIKYIWKLDGQQIHMPLLAAGGKTRFVFQLEVKTTKTVIADSKYLTFSTRGTMASFGDLTSQRATGSRFFKLN